MSPSSLVAAPSTTVPWNAHSGCGRFSVYSKDSSLHSGLFQAQVPRRYRVIIRDVSRGFTSLNPTSITGFSRLGRFWKDGNAELGIGGCELKKREGRNRTWRKVGVEARASSLQEGIMEAVKTGWATNPPTWEASFISMASIFVVGSPLLFVGLTKAGMVASYLLGSVIWRAYGGQGLATIVFFYAIGTAATKLKLKEKQNAGIAEKRDGRRGVGSVVGSGTAAAACALCSIYGIGGPSLTPLWQLGYLASLCTKLSDTISSEIGKAYGKITYLVTTWSVVPRGTEGAVSLEGTIAGVVAAIFLAAAAFALGQVDRCGAIIAVGASQVANLVESFLGATLQGRPGYDWLSNDVVNVVNVTVGAGLAILLGKHFGLGL